MLSKILCFISLIYITNQQECEFGNLDVVSDLLPKDCYAIVDGNKHYYYTEDGCLPTCEQYPNSPTGACDDTKPCTPGYKCNTAKKKCEEDLTTCAIYYSVTGAHSKTLFRPECAKDGYFAPKQCKGQPTTGRCFCFDAFGNRIFGQQWWNKADEMTCACSRKRADLLASGTAPYFISLHCNSMGNFEELQCDVLSEQCWCVDEKTGELTSAVVPDKAITKLPCYKSSKMGSQYLRHCESIKYAQAVIVNELQRHGTVANFGTLLCDDDGSYGPYKILDGAAYCTWRDNSNIGTWQSGEMEHPDLNCNCARDTMIFADAGKTQTQACEGWGDYKSYQVVGGTPYCIDKDGYKKSTTIVSNAEQCASIVE